MVKLSPRGVWMRAWVGVIEGKRQCEIHVRDKRDDHRAIQEGGGCHRKCCETAIGICASPAAAEIREL
jgi:hypothetical protein